MSDIATEVEILDAAWRIRCRWARPTDAGPKLNDLWPRIALECMALLEQQISRSELADLVSQAFSQRAEQWSAATRSAVEAAAKTSARKSSSADARAANTLALMAALQGSLAITPARDSAEGATPDG